MSARGLAGRDEARQTRDALADQMADGCPSISEAARRLGIKQSLCDYHWQAIRNDLDAASHVADGARWSV